MQIRVFSGKGVTYDKAAEKAEDEFIEFMKGQNPYNIMGFNIDSDSNEFGHEVHLWILLK